MIGEAVDTLVTLGWALAVWIVLMAAVASLALWTVVVTVWWAGRLLWRTGRALLGARKGLSGRLWAEAPEDAPRLPPPPEGRPAPRWARSPQEAPEPPESQEAA